MARKSRQSSPPLARDDVDPSEHFATASSRPRQILSMLRAMLSAVPSSQFLVATFDASGFQMRLDRPFDLPSAMVVGRHHRCSLWVREDRSVSLRHVLLTIWQGVEGTLRMRAYDLGGRGGILLADGQRVDGVLAESHLGIVIGTSTLFVLPGGDAGLALLEGATDDVHRRLTRVSRDDLTIMDGLECLPGLAHVGGYRQSDVLEPPNDFRGELRLSAPRSTLGRIESRTLEIDGVQLRQGLLIGRYSDRCSLAGSGRNLSRVHALVCEESHNTLLVYDLASTNGVRPVDDPDGPSRAVVRLTPDTPCMLGHFELSWSPFAPPTVH
ncbi:MAG: FHA domain-containing protein [Nannocystaceae bacterium]